MILGQLRIWARATTYAALLIIYIKCVFYIAHVAETDVQYSEAGTQIHDPALDLHNKFKQFFLVFG